MLWSAASLTGDVRKSPTSPAALEYGFIDGTGFEPERGFVFKSIVVRGRPCLFGLLGRTEDAIFPWFCARRFGLDIILVDGGTRQGRGRRHPRTFS